MPVDFKNYGGLSFKHELIVAKSHEIRKCGKNLFKYWKNVDESLKSKFEAECLQDLLHHSIFGVHEMNVKICILFESFVEQKKFKAVDTLLCQLLEPIIWRGLKAINSEVRYNAVCLFLLVFPMRNNLKKVAENEDLLIRQTNMFESLITDEVPLIRTRSILGVCKIFQNFWPVIPVATLKQIFTIFVKTLAVDSSSMDVRSAVFNAFDLVAENPASHSVLAKILPLVKLSIHDVAEKVRLAFVKLLLKLKKLNAVNYWEIVSMDHLLAKLSDEESPKIRQLVVELIFDSFCPPMIDGENPRETFKLERIVFLIESNSNAARNFFSLMDHFAPKLECSVEGVIIMLRCVWSCVKKSKIDQQENDQSSRNISTKNVENHLELQQNDELTTEENDSSAQQEQLTLENHAVICGLLECSVILWRTLLVKLLLEENLDIYKRLIKIASKIIQECFSFFMDERILNILLDMASLLKPSSVQYLSASTFKKLKFLEDVDDLKQESYCNLLKSTCFWRFSEVAETICSWLDGYGDLERTRMSVTRKRSKRIKFDAVSKNSNSSAKPRLALKYLEFLTTNIECRIYILKEHRNSLLQIRQKLREFLDQRDVLNPDKSNDKIGNDEILLAERLLTSIYFLSTSGTEKMKNREKSNLVEETVVFLQSKLECIVEHILPTFNENNENQAALQYLSQILLSCRHALILNISNIDFTVNLCEFLAKVFEVPSQNIRLFGEICQTLFNVVDFIANMEKPNKTSINSLINELVWPLVDRCCQKLIIHLQETNFFQENKHDLKIITEALVESFTLVERILMVNQCENGISLLAKANVAQIQNLLLENKNNRRKIITDNNDEDENCMETN